MSLGAGRYAVYAGGFACSYYSQYGLCRTMHTLMSMRIHRHTRTCARTHTSGRRLALRRLRSMHTLDCLVRLQREAAFSRMHAGSFGQERGERASRRKLLSCRRVGYGVDGGDGAAGVTQGLPLPQEERRRGRHRVFFCLP